MIRSVVAKAAPGVAASGAVGVGPAGFLPFEPSLALLAIAGVAIGAMIRVGRLVEQDAPRAKIRRDVTVSALIGLGNMIIVLFLHAQFGLDPLEMIGAAVAIGALGLEAIGMALGLVRKVWFSTIASVLDERTKTRTQTEEIVAEKVGEARNDMQAALSAERIKRKEGESEHGTGPKDKGF